MVAAPCAHPHCSSKSPRRMPSACYHGTSARGKFLFQYQKFRDGSHSMMLFLELNLYLHLGGKRQADLCDFQARLVYKVISWIPGATQ
ncbi:hypothetical protein I79_014655 [Cricetulus griseus]|uniref:Uncharacterized protein n=1 Tax=Cricetulus griseus TaxID=10029 RepID=G3HUP2_CRIGR|nr:hypothetical protein I79_014655 [Cricetulus griseus]